MKSKRRAPLPPRALVVLALLDEAPMYPYRMQQLIRDRGNDQIVNVRHRASLYQTMSRLQRDGLLEVQGTARTESRPERTVYQLTEAGRKSLHAGMREMLATPASEFPEFPAALSFIYLLEPEAARRVLSRRADALDTKQQSLAAIMEEHSGTVPRLFLLESEYMRAVTEAELMWVRNLIGDLSNGKLAWDPAAIRSVTAFTGGERDE